MIAPAAALAAVWRELGGAPAALDTVELTGAEPVLPSSFAVATAAQATLAASGLAAAELWRLTTGRQQRVTVDMRHAAIEFRSERYLRVDGKPAPELWDRIAGAYRCGDGRWVRVHTNFPHHRDGALELLGCTSDRADVQRALDGWKAEDVEQQAAERGLVIDMGRGKLSAQLDLRGPAGQERLRALLADADIFVQGYRPGRDCRTWVRPRGGRPIAAGHRLCLAVGVRRERPVVRPARI